MVYKKRGQKKGNDIRLPDKSKKNKEKNKNVGYSKYPRESSINVAQSNFDSGFRAGYIECFHKYVKR